MAGPAQPVDPGALVETARRRVGMAVAAANMSGAAVVFLFGAFGLPQPSGVSHPTRLFIINASVFGLGGLVGLWVGWTRSHRLWVERMRWLSLGRAPTPQELALTLRFPLAQQAIDVMLWGAAAVTFAAVNAPFSVKVAVGTPILIMLGGLVTCAVGYLTTERLMRPVTALALARAVPEAPQLPGVAARTLLSWVLGTGAVLAGLALVGVGAAIEPHFTRHRLEILIVALSIGGLLTGFLVMRALARSVAEPIASMRGALARVEAGDLETEVPVADGSEVGLLQAGFNRMVAGLRERERIRDLFGRHVGEDVVRHALEHGGELGGEAREAAVLFVDLKGSTTFAAERDPADVVELLNRFFAAVVDVVGAHGGWVNKFQGDGALCAFGVPLADPAAADHALCAARLLRDRLQLEVPELRAGIGVSAGRVVAGHIGAASRFEYTVIGDPVNEAARLSELAKDHRELVLASEAALDRADSVEAECWRADQPLLLRGRGVPTSVAAPV